MDLRDTLIIVSADHSHVFNIAGYPLRPRSEMPYPLEPCSGSNYGALAGNGILDLVYDVNTANRCAEPSTDSNGVPYTALVYGNGPGYRSGVRVDPTTDTVCRHSRQHGPAGTESHGLCASELPTGSGSSVDLGNALGRGSGDLRRWAGRRTGSRDGEEHVHLSRHGQGTRLLTMRRLALTVLLFAMGAATAAALMTWREPAEGQPRQRRSCPRTGPRLNRRPFLRLRPACGAASLPSLTFVLETTRVAPEGTTRTTQTITRSRDRVRLGDPMAAARSGSSCRTSSIGIGRQPT